MTLIAGVCGKDYCLITADNMVTHLGSNELLDTTTTILGHTMPRGKCESAFKIYTLYDGFIAGVAGNPEPARIMFDSLKACAPRTLRALKKYLTAIPQEYEKNFTCIIGLYDQEQKSNHLIKWSNREPQKVTEGSVLTAGSGGKFFQNGLEQLVTDLNTQKLTKYKICEAISLSLNFYLSRSTGQFFAENGVGGCFYTMLLDGEKLVPQNDTAILYIDFVSRKNILNIKLSKLAFRDGILFICNGDEKRALINTLNCSEAVINEIEEKQQAAFNEDEIWDLSKIKNIEIHFKFNGLMSYVAEANADSLSVNEEGNVVLSKELKEAINIKINEAGGMDNIIAQHAFLKAYHSPF